MAYEDEDSRVRMALLSEKTQAMDAAQDAHVRQFNDPCFHFVPRQKMMQIQSGCIKTMCKVLDANNRTNTWQRKDACVVEQCLSALTLYVHRRPERCRELQETRGGVQAIVTGMRECAENKLVQERGLKLVADTCLALESFAEAFVEVGVLETIVDGMDRFRQEGHLQACSCETISAIMAALPGSNRKLLARVLDVGAHRAVGRASRWHARSEDVLVAATQALETIALRCCGGGSGTKNRRACVQGALLLSNQNDARRGVESGENEGDSLEASTEAVYHSGDESGTSKLDMNDISTVSEGTGCILPADNGDGIGTATTDSQGRMVFPGLPRDGNATSAAGIGSSRRGQAQWQREGNEIGATSFALRVAYSYSRGDSRTIVRRAGAARVAASALSLLRALLTDFSQRRQAREDIEPRGERDARTENDEDEASLACCVQEFCDEQGVDILISAMEHHIHDATLLLAAWQAMHSVICIARRKQPLKASSARQTNHEPTMESYDAVAGGTNGSTPNDAENTHGRGLVEDVAEALLRRDKNLEQLVSVLTRAMDLHQAVAPLQWICLVCLIDLHTLEARVSDIFMIRSGCQILHRCIRINSRHTAVMEQSCRTVAVLSESSFTSRTRLFVEKIQDAIHQVIFLHRRHPGVYKLGNRALDALWGGDEFGAKQKASAAVRVHEGNDEDDRLG
eukprot:g12627.t1